MFDVVNSPAPDCLAESWRIVGGFRDRSSLKSGEGALQPGTSLS
ncbi:hypothetical protein [Synechococcus elongatus]